MYVEEFTRQIVRVIQIEDSIDSASNLESAFQRVANNSQLLKHKVIRKQWRQRFRKMGAEDSWQIGRMPSSLLWLKCKVNGKERLLLRLQKYYRTDCWQIYLWSCGF